MTLPDQLTVARVLAVPVVVVLFAWDFPDHDAWATGNTAPAGQPKPYEAAYKAMKALKPLATALMKKEISPGIT